MNEYGLVRIKLTRRNLTAIVAVVLAAGLGAFVLLDLVFANHLTPARATDMLQKASPRLVSVLRTGFNDEFSRIVKATVKSGDELSGDTAVARFLNHQTRPITERYGDEASAAPPDLVAIWMTRLADTMERVQAVAGASTCARYVNEGQSVLDDPAMMAELAPVFDARDAAFFAALAGARDAPNEATIGAATDSDWQAVASAMNGLEVPAGYAQIVATDDTTSSDYCSALAYYFRTVVALPGSAGERIRAEYFVRSFS